MADFSLYLQIFLVQQVSPTNYSLYGLSLWNYIEFLAFTVLQIQAVWKSGRFQSCVWAVNIFEPLKSEKKGVITFKLHFYVASSKVSIFFSPKYKQHYDL